MITRQVTVNITITTDKKTINNIPKHWIEKSKNKEWFYKHYNSVK